ncbi:hypothetical protein BMT54_07195 [Pasteurellaceae bacterium 15-036681]|nr:hypothetical protein BMT54_07195 [Pasteurellaceae bacterium 15-036681]
MFKKISLLAVAILLTACVSNPPSYLPAGNKPIVNIEASVNSLVEVDATQEQLNITNLTDNSLNVVYKLFWYDEEGVTQSFNDGVEPWQNLWLEPKQQSKIALNKPTQESQNYRIYLRGHR